MRVITAIAATELRRSIRNRWFAASVGLLAALAVTVALVGSTPTGSVAASHLAVATVGVASLSVYLLPLLALMLGFDAVVGELEQGTLAVLLSHPVARGQVLAGKYAAHAVVLLAAIGLGYGLCAALLLALHPDESADLGAWLAMSAAAWVLGLGFLSLGYLVSSRASRRAAAIAACIVVWLTLVVLYDLGVLVLLMLSERAAALVPAAIVANPVDSFRVLALSGSHPVAIAAGLVGIPAEALPSRAALGGSLLAWLLGPLAAAWALFARREP